MTHKIIALAMVLASFTAGHAQSTNDNNVRPENGSGKTGYFEVGMNAMRLFTLGSNQQNLSNAEVWNPYLFTAEGSYMNIGIRAGFATSKYTNTELPIELNGYTRYDNDTSSTHIRAGLFYGFNLDTKWTLKLGVDYFIANTETVEKQEFKEQSTQEEAMVNETHTMKESGFSPFVNIQYHITPRVSVGTELMWRMSNYTYTLLATDTRSEFDVLKKFEGSKSNMMAPTALFVTYRF